MMQKEMQQIREMVKQNPADIDELKTLSLISILADRTGQKEVSLRAKLIIDETLSQMVQK